MADILVDLGNHSTAIGIAGESEPMVIHRTLSCNSDEPLYKSTILSTLSKMAKEKIVGNNVLRFINVLNTHNILAERNYSALTQLFTEFCSENYLDPHDYGFIFITPPNLPINVRQALLEYMFTKLNIPRISFITPGMAVLPAISKDTAVVVDIGYFSTRIESFFKGFPNDAAVVDLNYGSFDMERFLIQEIAQKTNISLNVPFHFIVEKILQHHVRCELDPNQKIVEIEQGLSNLTHQFELPNGEIISLDKELFECVEILFNPSIMHKYSMSIVEGIQHSVRAWDRSNVPELLKNIVLIGSAANIPHLSKKVQDLVQSVFPHTLSVHVAPLDSPKSIIWKGGSRLYSLRKGAMEWIPNPASKA